MNKIYYTNYKQETRDSLLLKAQNRNAIIIDARIVPYSQFFYHWNKESLQEFFKEKYFHIEDLGNLNKGTNKEFKIKDIGRGIEFVKNALVNNSVIIFCACSDFNKCHLKEVIREIEERIENIEIEEL